MVGIIPYNSCSLMGFWILKEEISMKMRYAKVRGITWTCSKCGKVFTTEAQYAMHILMC